MFDHFDSIQCEDFYDADLDIDLDRESRFVHRLEDMAAEDLRHMDEFFDSISAAAEDANAWLRDDLSDLFHDDGSLSDQAVLELHEMDRQGFFI
jgi:hypothetical protein